MRTSQAAAAARAGGRRIGRAARSLSPLAAIAVTAAVVLGGGGVAAAANGGTFLLGRSNHESSTASLSNSKGTPLSLSAPQHQAPLKVNRNVEVKNLNSQYVGGLSAAALKTTGSDDYDSPGHGPSLPPMATVEVASTGKLAAGTYYVSASAEISLGSGDPFGGCTIVLNGDTDHPLQSGAQSGGPTITVSETVAVKVAANKKLQEWCGFSGSSSSSVSDAGLTAIRVRSSSGHAAH
jgi:hypothetical protein